MDWLLLVDPTEEKMAKAAKERENLLKALKFSIRSVVMGVGYQSRQLDAKSGNPLKYQAITLPQKYLTRPVIFDLCCRAKSVFLLKTDHEPISSQTAVALNDLQRINVEIIYDGVNLSTHKVFELYTKSTSKADRKIQERSEEYAASCLSDTLLDERKARYIRVREKVRKYVHRLVYYQSFHCPFTHAIYSFTCSFFIKSTMIFLLFYLTYIALLCFVLIYFLFSVYSFLSSFFLPRFIRNGVTCY